MEISFELLKLLRSKDAFDYYGHNDFCEFRINDLQFSYQSGNIVLQELSEVSFGSFPTKCTVHLKFSDGTWGLVIESVNSKQAYLTIDTRGEFKTDPVPEPAKVEAPSLWDSFEDRVF